MQQTFNLTMTAVVLLIVFMVIKNSRKKQRTNKNEKYFTGNEEYTQPPSITFPVAMNTRPPRAGPTDTMPDSLAPDYELLPPVPPTDQQISDYVRKAMGPYRYVGPSKYVIEEWGTYGRNSVLNNPYGIDTRQVVSWVDSTLRNRKMHEAYLRYKYGDEGFENLRKSWDSPQYQQYYNQAMKQVTRDKEHRDAVHKTILLKLGLLGNESGGRAGSRAT